MKKLLNSSKEWKNYQDTSFKEKKVWIMSENEKNPNKYPCVLVETKLMDGCEQANDQFVRFVYQNDFKNIK